jgi:purine-nucleoside phosphorylase
MPRMAARSPMLLLAAFPPELGELAGSPPPGWRVACVGIGAVAAGVETARLLAEIRPERVLLVGTCGAYDGRLAVGELISAAVAVATSLDEVEGRAYRPARERTRWRAGWELPFPAHAVAVPPGVTRSAAGARLLGRVAAAEHLELTGVFAACAAAGVPAAAALAVANRVGPAAQAEWRANHLRVSRALGEALRARGVVPRPGARVAGGQPRPASAGPGDAAPAASRPGARRRRERRSSSSE